MTIPRAALAFAVVLGGAACASNPPDFAKSDPGLKARIEAALRGRKDLDPSTVSIDVDNGVVTVSGIVTSASQRTIIDRIVKRMPGVDTLMDNLLVQE